MRNTLLLALALCACQVPFQSAEEDDTPITATCAAFAVPVHSSPIPTSSGGYVFGPAVGGALLPTGYKPVGVSDAHAKSTAVVVACKGL